MKKYYILLCAAVAVAAASCSEKEEFAPEILNVDKVQREFTAFATKTALQSDGATVVWEADDTISVFDGVANNKFGITGYSTPSASATFTGTVDSGATEFYAVYPYTSGNALDGSTVTGTVPATQTAKASSFDTGAAVAVARTTGSELAFHNVTALLGVKLAASQNNVKSIVLTGNSGEVVAGAVNATLSGTGAVTAIAPGSGSKSVTLSGTFSAGGMYYLAFIPQNFSEGITVTANYNDGKAAKLVSSLDWDAEAGKSYNVVDFGTAAYLEFDEERFTFDYGETRTVGFTAKNIASVNSITLPAGWTYTDLTSTSVKITAPVKTVVVGNPAGTIYKPVGDAVLACTTNASTTKNASVVVRLRGINSSEEFNEFRTAYGNGSASFSAGTSYGRRLNDCIDYIVNEEITLNDDISATQESAFPYYILHHIEHNLNGNGKTFTMTVNGSAWPTGFCQETFGTVTVHDLNLAGTINWTYSAAGTTGGVCGGFSGRLQNNAAVVSLTFRNVNNAVNINWTSASTADPTKHHAVGGFVGSTTAKPITFDNCTYSGTITKNCRNLATAGFVGWNSSTSVSKFDNCRFTGKIECTATSSKSAWTATTNLEFIGGFVGATDQQGTALLEFKGCESAGTIKVAGGARELGGFVGKASCPITFADNADAVHCTFNGSIDYTETDAPASAVNILGNVGGFIGMKTAFATSFTNCAVGSSANIKIVGGAYCAGGYIGQAQNRQESPSTATLTSFTGCTFGGTLDFSSYDKATSGNFVGRIGGFVGANGYHETNFTNCSVTTTGVVSSKNDITNSGGFVGNGGDTANNSTTKNIDRGTIIMNDCQFHGTFSHTAKYASAARRIGGFVGDASRVVKLTDCTFDGSLTIHADGKGIVGCGGFLGRTTAQAADHTMLFELNTCVFSGSFTVYNQKASNNVYGTLIGTNAATTSGTNYGVYVDGTAYTTNAALNYGTTSVTFLTE